MARHIGTFILLVVSLAAFAGEPILEFDKLQVDLGKVDPDSRVEVVFHFRNTGTAPLEIESVKPG